MAAQNFKLKFMALSDKHAPFVSVRKKWNGVPWITEEYIKLARERDFYRNKFKSTKLKADWDKFKVYRNQATKLNSRLKKEYYQDEFSRCGNDVNKNWKILKHLLPNKNKETDTKLVINELISDSKKIADLLNEEFNNVSESMDVQRIDIQRLPSFEVMIVTATWICAS